MVEKDEAYLSKDGEIYQCRQFAIAADLIADLVEIWPPNKESTGRPRAIGMFLVDKPEARRKLIEAIGEYEAGMETAALADKEALKKWAAAA
jgi:hypothetical protein